MCRIYQSKKGNYVRCCCRTGHKGLHIPLNLVIWTEAGHVSFGNRKASKVDRANKRCIICGGPVGKYNLMCELCKKGL